MSFSQKGLHAMKKGASRTSLFKQSKDYDELMSNYKIELQNYLDNLSEAEAISKIMSDINHFKRHHETRRPLKFGDSLIGDICYLDYGSCYLNEAAYQHFGLVMKDCSNKLLVLPMTSNAKAIEAAESKDHLFYIGQLDGMSGHSTLFMNDCRHINPARIINVNAHIDTESQLFNDIKERLTKFII